ncbi:MAG: glycosyltransferase family 4 protein [candidate division FCPU426 bacterium]
MRLLALSPVLPDAPSDGDKLRVFHFLREFAGRGHAITLAAFTDGVESSKLLSAFVPEIHSIAWPRSRAWLNAGLRYFGARPSNVSAYASGDMARLVDQLLEKAAAEGRPYDAVYCYRLRMAPYALRAKCRRVLDYTDSLTRYSERRATQAKGLKQRILRREAEKIAAYEAWCAEQFDACFLNSSEDTLSLRAMAPKARLVTAANGADFERLKPLSKPRDPKRMIFIGNLAYAPNVQALLWFYGSVMPLIRKKVPQAVLQVVGGGAPSALAQLTADPKVEMTGFAEDLNPLLNRAGLAICPVHLAAGRQNKILDAFATATPCVATRLAAQGVEAQDGKELLAADDAPGFAAAVLKLMADPSLSKRIGQAGLKFSKKHYRWDANARIIERELMKSPS